MNLRISKVNANASVIRKQLEVDFVANMGSHRYYIQSAFELSTPEKLFQEKNSLTHIEDSFKKIIIQRNPVEPWHDEDGVLRIGLMDFMLNPDSIDW